MKNTFSGLGLIENMAALLVLSIGTLGAGRLFTESLQQYRDNTDHRTAISLGEELADRVIAAAARSVVPKATSCKPGHTTCYYDADAESWLIQWRRQLQTRLPEPDAQLSIESAGSTARCGIEIAWRGRSGTSASLRMQFLIRR